MSGEHGHSDYATDAEFQALSEAHDALAATVAALADRVTALEAAPTPEPAPAPEPTGTTVTVKTKADLLAALADDLGPNARILVPKGTVLPALTLTQAHGGKGGNVVTIDCDDPAGEYAIDLGGATSYGCGILSRGLHDAIWRGFVIRNGNVDQMGAICLGDGSVPAPTVNVTFDRWRLEDLTGPAQMTSTSKATAHGVYVSHASAPHRNIAISRVIAHADAKGLAAFLHLYCAPNGISGLSVTDWQAFGFVQTVMSYAGPIAGVVLDRGYVEDYGQSVLRLDTGSGVVRNLTSKRGPHTVGKALASQSSGWTLESSVALA